MTRARRRATYDDVIAAPEHLVAEILDDELFTSPRPASPHAYAASQMTADLVGAFGRPPGGAGQPGGWWILSEPELHLGEDVLVPDLTGWRHERMPVVPNVAAFEQAPDWACEVISPSTSAIDRGRKMRIYARERIAHLWIVDPLARTLEIYRLDEVHWLLVGTHLGEERVHAEPFAAIELDIARWWLPS